MEHQEVVEVQVDLVPEDQEEEEETDLTNNKNFNFLEEEKKGELKNSPFFVKLLPATFLYWLFKSN